MIDSDKNSAEDRSTGAGARHSSLSMHDDIPVWYDCCSCEMEPYWREAMESQTGKKSSKAETGK